MRVCLIATEYAGIGPYGGFGALTKQIAEGLARRGVDVCVAMSRKPDQKPIERRGDVTVVSYPSPLYVGLKAVQPFATVFRMLDADIYHSEEPWLGTRLAQMGAPHRKHMITFQDPRTIEDWRCHWAPRKSSRWGEFRFLTKYRRDTGMAVKAADALFGQAHYACERAVRVYGLKTVPDFLPNPVDVPEKCGDKATAPTVCFVGRWDTIKRPEFFLDLAGRFPEVTFIAAGACTNDPAKDKAIRERYRGLANVELPGWVDANKRSEILDRSWMLINTSVKECLPVTYLEACAHRCAILSHRNIDDFPRRFGHWVEKGRIEDFAEGLEYLLEHNRWRELGDRGYEHVRQTYEYEKVIDQHIRVYKTVLGQS